MRPTGTWLIALLVAAWGAPLKAGPHEFRLEYLENTGGQAVRLQWEGPGMAAAAVPASACRHPHSGSSISRA